MISIKNLRNVKPQNPWDVKVDRSNKILGNQFYMADESQRDEVCEKYKNWFTENCETNQSVKTELNRLITIYTTYGKINLFCWCAPKRCHAETIRDYILSKTS